MTLYQRLRMKNGLRWPKDRPPTPWKEMGLIGLIIVAYGIVGTIDHHASEIERLENLARTNQDLAQVALDCLNNSNGFYYKDAGLAVTCSRI